MLILEIFEIVSRAKKTQNNGTYSCMYVKSITVGEVLKRNCNKVVASWQS